MKTFLLSLLALCLSVASAAAHDTWVESNTNLIRARDAVYINLKLGNHGNHHRDFKIASKIDLEGCKLEVIDPTAKVYDLISELTDTGYAPKEGYWRGKFVPVKPGLYTVSHSLDKIVNHGKPVRAIKSAKTCFVVSARLDQVPLENPGFDRALGHPLELIPVVNPVTPMGPGKPIEVRVDFKGKPLADVVVSFVPQGETLQEGFDERFERKTDAAGRASFTPKTGNQYLAVVHHLAKDESAADYQETAYAATLTVFVPEICPCCGD
ncbi:DUF4198 domain-containing protein [uncultured Gimesia sp.]|jgi:uncharacterized GH25 family protein|uniref:DUF4198 domain-containing protein n=1 Tax=uncultured Gimesia sp. TaxID=1678688 RepID=UPI002616B5F6|nr:DUF4198 domain-containing protein [uncultured Gimesia sp.]